MGWIPEDCPYCIACVAYREEGSKHFARFVAAGDYSLAALEDALEKGYWVLWHDEEVALRSAIADAREEEEF